MCRETPSSSRMCMKFLRHTKREEREMDKLGRPRSIERGKLGGGLAGELREGTPGRPLLFCGRSRKRSCCHSQTTYVEVRTRCLMSLVCLCPPLILRCPPPPHFFGCLCTTTTFLLAWPVSSPAPSAHP